MKSFLYPTALCTLSGMVKAEAEGQPACAQAQIRIPASKCSFLTFAGDPKCSLMTSQARDRASWLAIFRELLRSGGRRSRPEVSRGCRCPNRFRFSLWTVSVRKVQIDHLSIRTQHIQASCVQVASFASIETKKRQRYGRRSCFSRIWIRYDATGSGCSASHRHGR